MIALVLLAYAALLIWVAAPLMRRSRTFDRVPGLGILAWQVLVISIVLSLVLSGFVFVVPTMPISTSIAEFIRTCFMIIQQRYASPGGAVLAGLSLALALALLGRTVVSLGHEALASYRARRNHRQALALVGRGGPAGLTVLEHPVPAVYCLPGRGQRIVATSGALAALNSRQLAAVLAHENAHLRGKHHLVLLASGALASALPINAIRTAHAEIVRLVELAADDDAARRTDRLELAEALIALAEGRSSATTLAASGTTAAARVRRLINSRAPLCLPAILLGAAVLVLALILPLAVAAGPALAASGADYCPTGPFSWQTQMVTLRN